jgi:hypothetical protein
MHEIEVRILQHGAAIDLDSVATGEDYRQLASQLEAIWTNLRIHRNTVRSEVSKPSIFSSP